MANESAYLLKLISAIINGHSAERDDSADLALLFRIAKYHNLANIACYALEGLGYSKEELKDFLSEKHKALFKAAVYESELEAISKACEEKGIAYMPLKGSVIKYLYPSIDMRTSVDIDILYDGKKKDLMRKVMADMSYKFLSEGNNHDEFSKAPFTVVEMHTGLISERHKNSGYFDNVWNHLRRVGQSFKYEMTDEYFYIFMISHLEKHFSEGGIGVRSFLDIYLFLQKKQIDRNAVNTEFKKLGIEKFAEYAEKLAMMWFSDAEGDELLENMAEFVFKSGEKGTAKILAIRQRTKSKNKFSYYLSLIFPSYTEMTYKYPKIKNSPPLVVFYWFKRIFEVISNKDRIKNKVEPMGDGAMQEKISRLMKKLELD